MDYGCFQLIDVSSSPGFEDDIEDQALLEAMNEIEGLVQPVRFKKLDQKDLECIEDAYYSKSTKRNTKWGVGVFNAWCYENGHSLDISTISSQDMNAHLRTFYAEAAPKDIGQRAKKMPEDQAAEYHKNTLKNVRAAINRHLKEIGRNIDIVRDKDFASSNKMLNAKLKTNLKQGVSRPTQHFPVIPPLELEKITLYLQNQTPVALRFRVWYLLSYHFVSRGLEFHQQLKISSLIFTADESGCEYISISHETQQKNHQGGISQSLEESYDKRLYATGGPNCPVSAIKMFLSKTEKSAVSLFNHCSQDSLKNPSLPTWYTATPVKARQFTQFMPDICKNAGIQRYTAHSIRATAITALNDAGISNRSIMFMSDHTCEDSLKSYSRRPSVSQKKNLSAVLGSASAGQIDSLPHQHSNSSAPFRTPVATCTSTSLFNECQQSNARHTHIPVTLPHPPSLPLTTHAATINSESPSCENQQHSIPSHISNQFTSSVNTDSRQAGFGYNACFNNCTFVFGSGQGGIPPFH